MSQHHDKKDHKPVDLSLKEEFGHLMDKYKKKLASSFKNHLPALRAKLDELEKEADSVSQKPQSSSQSQDLPGGKPVGPVDQKDGQ